MPSPQVVAIVLVLAMFGAFAACVAFGVAVVTAVRKLTGKAAR